MNVKTIYIEITNICNLNCRTCYNRSGLNRKRREITKAQIEKIIHIFSVYGLKRVLFSGGEPTLHSGFDEILNLIGEYPLLSFGIVTNGTNHNPKLMDVFNTSDNLTLQISLDGSSEERNAATRGIGHFASVVEFANKICNPNKKPLLKMVISQSNYEDIESYYRFAVSLGCIPEYAFIYKFGNAEESWSGKGVNAIQKIKAVKLIERLNREFDIHGFLPLCTSRCPYSNGPDNLSLCIKVDGSIQPCQSLYRDKYSVGNVFVFDESVFAGRLNDISELAATRTKADFGCAKCIIAEYCGRGCMAAADYIHSDPLAGDGDCGYRKMQFIEGKLKGSFNNG